MFIFIKLGRHVNHDKRMLEVKVIGNVKVHGDATPLFHVAHGHFDLL